MVRYKMVGRDVNSIPKQYRTWVVNTPDFTGASYPDGYLKSGTNDLVDIVAYYIKDDGYVVDFNLPTPKIWNTTKKVLPDGYQICDAQLAVVDGYVYLFGGVGSKKICRASLNNPATWTDTGALLPSTLYGSQLAIVDGYIYLFGGNDSHSTSNNYAACKKIYRAHTNDPLTWIDTGASLPGELQNSQLFMGDGYLHLFGGIDGYAASNAIYIASISAPTVWTNTGLTLPDELYGSQIGLIDGYAYLFGGFNSLHATSSNIYKAQASNLTSWSLVGSLPVPMTGAQFFTIDGYGYLIGAANSGIASYTNIFRCDLTAPSSWVSLPNTVPGTLYQSQVAIIADRVFMFGGNGQAAIFACDQDIQYSFTNATAVSYGLKTRTTFKAIDNVHQPFLTLGFPYWKTSYS
jgi:hypothetical protein